MNALERLEAAIQELERLRDESFDGPWHALTSGRAGGDHWYVTDADQAIASISANDGEDEDLRGPTAELIVTLHRTIDAQLAILRAGLTGHQTLPHAPDAGWAHEAVAHAANFADAILGDAS